ncbi:MAG: hypothetical protein LBF74_12560 [Treponema sp.]|nr:hypothetical protein [Treponema sp.]
MKIQNMVLFVTILTVASLTPAIAIEFPNGIVPTAMVHDIFEGDNEQIPDLRNYINKWVMFVGFLEGFGGYRYVGVKLTKPQGGR